MTAAQTNMLGALGAGPEAPTLRVISLWQPWATLCVTPDACDPRRPAKVYETRHWSTDFRGTVAIHASKKWTRELREIRSGDAFVAALIAGGYSSVSALPLGSVVGLVDVVDVWSVGYDGRLTSADGHGFRPGPRGAAREFGDFSPGRFAWELRNPRPLSRPLPLVGRQTPLWVPPADVAAAILRLAAPIDAR